MNLSDQDAMLYYIESILYNLLLKYKKEKCYSWKLKEQE